MKKILGIFTVLLLVSFLTVNLMANIGNVPGLQKGTDIATTQVGRTMSNISNWGYWVYSDGKSANDPHGSSGGIYPRGTAGAVYRDGFIWGGKVDTTGNGVGDLVQVGGQTYNTGTVAGRILPDGTGADANDPAVKVYRIRSDYKDLTVEMVKQDAMEINLLGSLGDVTDAMCEDVITEYEESWEDWPAEWGAPYTDVDGNGSYDPAVDKAGLADADQVLWLVINDLNTTAVRGLYGSDPIGFELQITIWAYNQPAARLGQVVFKKFKLINKSGKDVTDMYVSQWADPDLGDYGDDLCGCDTTLSLGFAYNGSAIDNKYKAFGLAPAAFGYDFFQGPMVPSVGETAVFDLKKVADHKNLGMTSFGWFAAGSPISDPTLGEYEGTRQWYNLLQGFKPFDDLAVPAPWTEGNASGGTVTKFPLAGDPVAGTGFLDNKDGYYPPGDRRITLSSGPFTFADGDTQEVVVAAIGGLGGDRFSSITSMKGTDQIAQSIYDNLFAEIPKPPVSPKLKTIALEGSVMLNWGYDQDAIDATEGAQSLDYEFEGYNIYQLPTPSSSLAQGTKIKTFDVVNNITNIRGTVLDPNLGEIEKNIQEGYDTGIQRFFYIEKNYLTETKLNEGQTYWFAVTAYNQDMNLIVDKALESSKIVYPVTIQESLSGTEYEGEAMQQVTATHSVGGSDGVAGIYVIDPSALTGDDYQISFSWNVDSTEKLWTMENVTEGTIVAEDQHQSPTQDYDDQLVIDGLLIKISGPDPGVKYVHELDASDNIVDEGVTAFGEVNIGGASLGSTGYLLSNRAGSVNNTDYSRDWDRFGYWGTDDIVIDFGETSLTWDYSSDAVHFDSLDGSAYYGPFSAYRTTVEGDTYRLFAGFWDTDGDGTWNNNGSHWAGPIFGAPSYEPIYCWQGYDASGNEINYDPANDATYISENSIAVSANAIWGASPGEFNYPYITAMLFTEYLGGPPIGNKVKFVTNKPNTLSDVFTFTAPAVNQNDSVMTADLEKINVYPNPFYAHNPLASHRYDEYITFTHLPEKATIQIYNLAGVLVTTVEHDNATSPFEQWDLTNASGLPVASGMYIAYIDMPDEDASKTLKFVIIQKKQILEYY
ncbi:MAG: T9SS type A sorting domain-containing protein [Candidatus Marinimicrobia bacterium]|nr:T9SS type A sorting domain-containing protein [Candidatus Neomarinimicrobiota bacterium]